MTDYVKSTNFASKDSLATGNPLKIVKGTEIDTEFNNIATAVATKADIVSPTFTGTPSAPTASTGTNSTQLANSAFVKNAIDTYDAALTVSTSQIEDSAVTAIKLANNSVSTVKILDSSVTEAKLADSSVTTGKIADANVTPAKLSQPLTLGTAKATTSGTTVEFTGIPSWVKRITVMFNGVSTNGSSDVQIQLGTSGGFTTSGYLGDATNLSSAASTTAYTAGFGIQAGGASVLRHGLFIISNVNDNSWVASGNIGISGLGNFMSVGAGSVTLPSVLDRIRITTVNGTDTFDAGSVNIMYEG